MADKGATTQQPAVYDLVTDIVSFNHIIDKGATTQQLAVYDLVTDIVSFNHIKNKGATTQQTDVVYYDVITNFGNNIIPGTGPTMYWSS